MGKVAVHYGWIPMILYIGQLPPLLFSENGLADIVGYTQSSPRPALWKYLVYLCVRLTSGWLYRSVVNVNDGMVLLHFRERRAFVKITSVIIDNIPSHLIFHSHLSAGDEKVSDNFVCGNGKKPRFYCVRIVL